MTDPGILWDSTASLEPTTTALSGEVRADVAVIGAGYTGLSTALHLARATVKVVLLESEHIGYGGSGRNAGHCTPLFQHYSLAGLRRRIGPHWAERMIALQTNAGNLVFDLIAAHGIECEASKNGFLQVAHLPRRMRALAARCADYEQLGCATRVIGKEEAEFLTGSPRFFGGWMFEEAGHLNPLGYARGLARAALSLGAEIYTGSKAVSIERAGLLWRVRTACGSVLADRLVIATGAYGEAIWPGLPRTYVRSTVACMASDPIPAEHRAHMLPRNNHVLDTRGDFTNFRLDRDGRLVTSLFVEGRRGGDKEATKKRMSDRFQWLFPRLPRLSWKYYWFGDVDLHPDAFPQFIELAPGVTTAVGYSSRGVPTATAMGAQIALHATGTPAHELSVRLSRMQPVSRLFGMAPRILLPYYRLRDAIDARLDGIAAC